MAEKTGDGDVVDENGSDEKGDGVADCDVDGGGCGVEGGPALRAGGKLLCVLA
jgi:hypothetical protein